MSLSQSVNLAHAQTPVPCNVCEEDVPGQYYCVECKHTLCEVCENLHKKSKRGHSVVLRSQIGNLDTATMRCAEHGELSSFHCEKCEISVCSKCITGNHQGHKLVDLTESFEKKKKLLKSHINEIQKSVLPELVKQENEIKSERENYGKKIQEITKDMEKENQSLHAELDRFHHERMKSLDSTQQQHLMLFDSRAAQIKTRIEKCKRIVSEYQDAIGKNSLSAVVNLAERQERLPMLRNKTALPKLPLFVPANEQKIVENLQKLQASHLFIVKHLKQTTLLIISKFSSSLEGDPRIYIAKEVDVWLGGHKTRELAMVNVKGQVLKKRSIKTVPYMLAVMNCGDVIIIPQGNSSITVSRLMADGREQDVFDPSPSCRYGVSVTDDQKLVICTLDGRVVRVDGDGTNVKEIYNGRGTYSARHAIENTDCDIYICDSFHSAVVVVGKDGKVKSTITHTIEGEMLGRPSCLVIDRMGNILCTDTDNNCVYIIDRDREMWKLVGSSHDIKNPSCLALDNDNNLWITQKDGTVVVLKYLA